MNGNGTEPEDDEPDLLGVVEIALRETREELRPLVERLDALEDLRRRAIAVAAKNPADLSPITGDALRAAALLVGEEDLARLELVFDRLTT